MRKKMPKVSIIVAVYNTKPEYLKQCVDSLLAQTMEDIEILLIDDGSVEECAAACDSYAKADSRIIVHHKENEGESIALNLGIEMARGECITFVDHDDWADPKMCQKAYEKMTQTHAEMVLWSYYSYCKNTCDPAYYKGNPEVIYTEGSLKKLQAQIIDVFAYEEQQIALAGSNWAKLYKMEFLKNNVDVRFPEHMMGGEDAIFAYKALNRVKKAVYFHENLYYYRQNDQSYTKRYKPDMLDDEIKMLRMYKELIDHDSKLEECLGKAACNSLIAICRGFLFHKENRMSYRQKRQYLKKMLYMPEYEEALKSVKVYHYKPAKALCLQFAHWKCVDVVLLLIYLYARKSVEERFE